MFSSKDFEKCWFLYQTEGLPHGLSIEQFCQKQGVPVNEFNKWYRDTHKRIHPIQVDGIPSADAQVSSVETPAKEVTSVRIAVTICISNGLLHRNILRCFSVLLLKGAGTMSARLCRIACRRIGCLLLQREYHSYHKRLGKNDWHMVFLKALIAKMCDI